MWHEARRREKATQKLFNDHKKRAGKRREENKVDTSSLLQVHGLKSKINLDPNTHLLAGRSMVVWQGDQKTTIDRFDVRTTLSSIPTADRTSSSTSRVVANQPSAVDEARKRSTVLDVNESESMKKVLNYERYRLLIQNDLNRVPEAKRLGMVTKSESLSEAKMRKLEKNYFGTSGEAALSNEQYAVTTSHHHHRSSSNLGHGNHRSQSKPQGVAIGFTYGSAQPSSYGGYDEVDSEPPLPHSGNPSLSEVIDLDDYEDLDLDCVDKRLEGSKVIDATLSKYGLNCDELNILIETADDKTTCLSAKEIIRHMKLMREKNKQERLPKPEQASEFYGPTLPPEMKPINDDPPDNEDEPVGQRSPRALDLPDVEINDRSASRSPARVNNGSCGLEQDLEQIPIPPGDPETLSEHMSSTAKIIKNRSGAQSSLKNLIQSQHNVTDLEPTRAQPEALVKRDVSSEPRESRRASTPLAYKRYRRSSRSLSLERSRNRSSSRSSATSADSSSSSGSSSSSTSSSYSGSSSTGGSGSHSSSDTERRKKGSKGGRSRARRSRSPEHKRRASTRSRRSRDHRRRRR